MARKSKQRIRIASEFQDFSKNPIKKLVAVRILIVCEGTKTEPNYFKSFNKNQNEIMVFDVSCIGTATNTIQVVDKAIELRNLQATKGEPYDSVWAVFDRDSFKAADFNAAIKKAKANDIGCAWSNEAFELWYVYHFDNRCTALPRQEHQKIITDRISTKLKGYKYKKNDVRMKEFLTKYGDEEMAVKYAEMQAKQYCDSRYATHNPCTMVYKLVRLLRGEDTAFNNKIMADMNQMHS